MNECCMQHIIMLEEKVSIVLTTGVTAILTKSHIVRVSITYNEYRVSIPKHRVPNGKEVFIAPGRVQGVNAKVGYVKCVLLGVFH